MSENITTRCIMFIKAPGVDFLIDVVLGFFLYFALDFITHFFQSMKFGSFHVMTQRYFSNYNLDYTPRSITHTFPMILVSSRNLWMKLVCCSGDITQGSFFVQQCWWRSGLQLNIAPEVVSRASISFLCVKMKYNTGERMWPSLKSVV